MPTYELDGERATYWEINLNGRSISQRTGRAADMRKMIRSASDPSTYSGGHSFTWVDRSGEKKTIEYPDVERARAAFVRAIAARKRAGYRLIHGVEEIPDDSEARRNLELEAPLFATPDDTTAILVYGDWLQSIGDARGELIALQAEMHGLDDRARFMQLKKVEQSLMARHQAAWLSEPVAAQLARIKLTWQRGFVSAARFGYFEAAELEPLVRALFTAPAGILIRRLDVESHHVQPAIRAALEAVKPRCLTTLSVYGSLDAEQQGALRAAIPTLRNIA